MVHIPQAIANYPLGYYNSPLEMAFNIRGLTRTHRGKVRDTYTYQGNPNQIVVVSTDRLSIFDIVLNTLVEDKGEVLSALTHFWLTVILAKYPNHLIRSIHMPRVNRVRDLFENFESPNAYREILVRSLLVQRVDMLPYEFIFRRHLGGSVWRSYEETGKVAGIQLPKGLQKWQELDEALFTPSTKAVEGHDENITQEQFFDKTGEIGRKAVQMLLEVYQIAYHFAKSRGILILDTKFEVGINPLSGEIVLADEVLTPDSSRFTSVEEYKDAMSRGVDPTFYDKEPVREWGRTVEAPFGVTGLQNLKPLNPEHLAFVDTLEVPFSVVTQATRRYKSIFEMITGEYLDKYQERVQYLPRDRRLS